MPGFDGTGPMGMGPMTGGGRGYCAMPVSGMRAPFAGGRRASFGRGGGRGWRRQYFATGMPGWARYAGPAGAPAVADEVTALKEHAAMLAEELAAVRERLDGLEKGRTAADTA